MVRPYLHTLIRLHGIVLNHLIKYRVNFTFYIVSFMHFATTHDTLCSCNIKLNRKITFATSRVLLSCTCTYSLSENKGVQHVSSEKKGGVGVMSLATSKASENLYAVDGSILEPFVGTIFGLKLKQTYL
jgi:hypothetical protein